ncbi:PepSY domain-containing protein [Streptomyces sp. NPDC056670]|uniref:PepSY domain-containing protein n=1 Tax=Streptomyces sp. NPDC056670 TaxID=3345904 RepID=UPI0036C5D800
MNNSATATPHTAGPVRRHRRPAAVVLAAGALALSLSACGGSDTDAGVDKARAAKSTAPAAAETSVAARTPPPGPAAPSADASASPERGGPKTSRTQALATAEKAVSGGRMTEVRLENEHGNQVWKVDVMTADPRVHNLKIDATTGALLGNRADQMPERARQYLGIPLAKLASAKVDREAAVRSAVEKAGGGFVSRLSIQGTEAGPVWQIRINDGTVRHELDVDAKTGAIARHEEHKNGTAKAPRSGGNDADTGSAGDSSGERGNGGRISEQEVRERSGNFGKDFYDWSQHVPR